MIDAARSGALSALVLGGADVTDLPDPDAALAALAAVPFVVSLELRESDVTRAADVVFPVAPVAEKDVDAIVAYLTAMPSQKVAPATGKAQDPDPKVAPDVSGGTG